MIPISLQKRRAVVRSLLAGGAVLSLGAGGRTRAAAAGESCQASPEETSGPFPADGSQLGRGPRPFMGGPDRHPPGPPPPGMDRPDPQRKVPNILAAPGIVRRDIRASFAASSTVAAGVPLRVELILLDLARACQPFTDARGLSLELQSRRRILLVRSRDRARELPAAGCSSAITKAVSCSKPFFPACLFGPLSSSAPRGIQPGRTLPRGERASSDHATYRSERALHSCLCRRTGLCAKRGAVQRPVSPR